jgi:hypothetical protein
MATKPNREVGNPLSLKGWNTTQGNVHYPVAFQERPRVDQPAYQQEECPLPDAAGAEVSREWPMIEAVDRQLQRELPLERTIIREDLIPGAVVVEKEGDYPADWGLRSEPPLKIYARRTAEGISDFQRDLGVITKNLAGNKLVRRTAIGTAVIATVIAVLYFDGCPGL